MDGHRGQQVALLAEGVDRNIVGFNVGGFGFFVALLAEGVDRNATAQMQRLFL